MYVGHYRAAKAVGVRSVTTGTVDREQERKFAAKQARGIADALDGMGGDEYAAAVEPPKSGGTAGEPGQAAKIKAAIFDTAQSAWEDNLGDARVPIPGSCDMLIENTAHYFYGGRGSGKSTVVLTLGMSVAMRGCKVLMLDRENGAALTRSRMDAAMTHNPNAFEEDTLREHFDALHWPEFRKDWNPEEYAEVIAERVGEGGVVVYDSVRELVNQFRASNNSDDDWSDIYAMLATPLIHRGIASVFCDNTGHQATERAKGAGAKMDAAPQGYRIWAREEFAPEMTGVVGIECNRSRLGDIGREWRQTLGGGLWELPTESTDNPTPTTWTLLLGALADGEDHDQREVAEAIGRDVRTVRRQVNNEHSRARKEERDPAVKREERDGLVFLRRNLKMDI